MSSLIEPWACASRLVGEDFNLDQQPHPNVSRGYALPEPAIFTNHHEDGSCQTYFSAMWLKLQLVIMHCIHRHGTLACLRHPNDWHKILGFELHGEKKLDSKAAEICQKFIVDMQVELDAANIVCAYLLCFNFSLIFCYGTLTSMASTMLLHPGRASNTLGIFLMKFVKKILQELFTISFKLDVGMTDCYLYWLQLEGFDTSELEEGKAVTFDELDASTCEEHHVKVASFQPGFTGESNTDFSLWDVAKWRAVMHKLYFFMLS